MSLRDTVYKKRSVIEGYGLFAKREIKKGEYIGEYEGPDATRNGKYVLWTPDGEARSGRNVLRYLNHSRKPNAEFDGFELYARRRIKVDEEITFDYGDDSFDFY